MKRKKVLVALATAVALTMAASGAVSAEEAEKVISVGQDTEPESLDPSASVASTTYRLLQMSGEALLREYSGEELYGGAESYEVNEDHTEYIFKLRKESCFSDGTPIVAGDYVYAVRHLLNPENAFDAVNLLFTMKNAEAYYYGECDVREVGVEAVDDYTLKVTMAVPTYPQFFTTVYFMPIKEDVVEEFGGAYGAEAETVLTNGPFNITSWVHDSEVILEKNPNYWNVDAVNLDKIICKINATSDVAVDMMQVGELDVASVSSQNQIDTLEDSGLQTLTQLEARDWLHVNHKGMTEESGLFLGNANFRKALSYAIDREALVSAVLTTGIPATRVVYPDEAGVEGVYAEEFPYEGWTAGSDPEKAKEYLDMALKELGKTVEDIPELSILCYDSNNNMIVLNAIMDMWSKNLGVKAVIDAQPIQNMFQKKANYEYDFWKGSTSDTDVDSMSEFYRYYSGSYNFEDAEYNKLYEAAQMAGTWEERKEDLFELEKYFGDHMMDLLITWTEGNYIYNDRVEGVILGPNGFDVTFADVQE